MRIGINAHILSFSASYRQAGLSRYIYELLAHLPACDPHARFTAFVSDRSVPQGYLRGERVNVRLSRSRLPTVAAPVRIAWEQTVLPFAAARYGLDLLHCPVNVRPLYSPCPTVITVHDLVFLRYPESFHPLKRIYLTRMTRWSAHHSTHVIAVSEATRRDVIDLLGVDPQRVTTVQNGVSDRFVPATEAARRRFREDKELPEQTILFVGTLEPRKNLVMLLHAFAALSSDPALAGPVLLIGGSPGWYYDEIFATAQRLRLVESGRVRFLGRIPDEELPLWYNTATVFAYPSRYEGFGLPALESMACGTPVIVSNSSSFPEVVGDAGLLVDPDEQGAWTNAMRRVLTEPALAQELAGRGLLRASDFSWDRTASETFEVYRQALSAGRVSPRGERPARMKRKVRRRDSRVK